MTRRAVLILLLVLAVCPYFIDLGGSSIWDANEAFYVETPREMMERGDFVVPTFNYEPRLNKPVLSYWIVAGFYKLFGVSVGVQRIPIAIGGLALIAVAFFLARAASPDGSRERAVEAGLWAALGLAVSPRLLMFARRIFIDIYITAFMALTLLFFACAERYPPRRRLFLVLMYVSIGLATLTKGPVAIALPGLVFLLYLIAHRELRRAREMLIVPGVLIVAAIVVPWYAALYVREGWDVIIAFVLGENLARYTEGVGVNADRGLLFYVPVVFGDSFPWSLLLPAAAVSWFRTRRSVDGDGAPRRIQTLMWLWILTIVGFFSLSAGKQDLYIFPIVPAVAALAGVAATAVAARTGPTAVERSVRWGSIVAGVVLAIVGGALVYLFQWLPRASADHPGPAGALGGLGGSVSIAYLALFGGLIIIALARGRRVTAALGAIAAVLLTFNWLLVLRVLPDFERYKPVPALARVLEARAAPDDVIASYNVAVPSLVYYLRRHMEMEYDPAPILAALASPKRAFVIVSDRDYYEGGLSPATATTCVISRHQVLDMKLRELVERSQLPELLLITNRCGEGQERRP